MARRVALARAIVLDPELLVYDEPFVGLDPVSMGVVVRLIKHLNDALGITSIVVSHDVAEVAASPITATCSPVAAPSAQGTTAELNASTGSFGPAVHAGASDGPVSFHYPAGDYVGSLLDSAGPEIAQGTESHEGTETGCLRREAWRRNMKAVLGQFGAVTLFLLRTLAACGPRIVATEGDHPPDLQQRCAFAGDHHAVGPGGGHDHGPGLFRHAGALRQ